MEVEINLMGVAAAAIAAMVVGATWYAKALFGEAWMKAAKISEKQAKEKAAPAMVAMAILAILAAYVIAHVSYLMYSFDPSTEFMMTAVQTAFWMWLGFVLWAQIGNAMFEQRPMTLIKINVGNSLVTFLVMGLVIGAIGL